MVKKQDISDIIQYHNGIENFNYDFCIDWAIDLIDNGIENDNILMLASFSKPVNSIEIKPYLRAVLSDLEIEEKIGDEAIIALIYYYLANILNDYLIRNYLHKVYDLFIERDYMNGQDKFKLMPFYLLYHGWSQLEDIGENFYYHGADLDNIEKVIKEQAQIWVDEFINGIRIEEDISRPIISESENGNEKSWWKRLWR